MPSLGGVYRAAKSRVATKKKIGGLKKKIANAKSASKFMRGEKLTMSEGARALAGISGGRQRRKANKALRVR